MDWIKNWFIENTGVLWAAFWGASGQSLFDWTDWFTEVRQWLVCFLFAVGSASLLPGLFSRFGIIAIESEKQLTGAVFLVAFFGTYIANRLISLGGERTAGKPSNEEKKP